MTLIKTKDTLQPENFEEKLMWHCLYWHNLPIISPPLKQNNLKYRFYI